MDIYMFANTGEALAFAQENIIYAAFICLGGLQLTGYYLAMKILALQKTNIIFTNYEREHLTDAFDLRISGYIHKPLRHEDIAEEMGNLRYPIADANAGITDEPGGNKPTGARAREYPRKSLFSRIANIFRRSQHTDWHPVNDRDYDKNPILKGRKIYDTN